MPVAREARFTSPPVTADAVRVHREKPTDWSNVNLMFTDAVLDKGHLILNIWLTSVYQVHASPPLTSALAGYDCAGPPLHHSSEVWTPRSPHVSGVADNLHRIL